MEIERKILRHLHGKKTRAKLREIHAHFLRHGLNQSNQILSHFVSVCASQNQTLYASRLFTQSHNPNLLLFNAMIKAHSLTGPFEQSLHLFRELKLCGLWPDEYTFAPLLKACSNGLDVGNGRCVHKECVAVGMDGFCSLQIGLLELYVTGGFMDDACKVFDEMSKRGVIAWNLMIRGWCKKGDVDSGFELFRRMSERNVVSWNTMISCLAQSGRDDEGLALFLEMVDKGFEPDEATLVTVLPICVRLRDLDVGRWVYTYAESSGLFKKFVSVGNALVDFFSKCGDVETARCTFDKMSRRSVISWNTLIFGLAINGKGEDGVGLFDKMIKRGVTPNDATFVGVLSCCAHAGIVETGRNLFVSMSVKHGLVPKPEHYGCMVDLFGRSGRVIEAYELIRSMSEKPNAALWGALLSACHTHGDKELAEIAAKELIDLEPWNSGNYILLSNIYAQEERWDEVEKLRLMMKNRNVKKSPGQSAIG